MKKKIDFFFSKFLNAKLPIFEWKSTYMRASIVPTDTCQFFESQFITWISHNFSRSESRQ